MFLSYNLFERWVEVEGSLFFLTFIVKHRSHGYYVATWAQHRASRSQRPRTTSPVEVLCSSSTQLPTFVLGLVLCRESEANNRALVVGRAPLVFVNTKSHLER